MSSQPVPLDEKKKPTLLWWILGLLGVGVFLLGSGGLFLAWYLSRHMEVATDGTRAHVEIQTPFGGLKVNKDDKADPGLPVYPGATISEGAASVELSAPDGQTLHVTAAKYNSDGPIEKIDQWYRQKLSPDFQREGPGAVMLKKHVFGVEVRSNDLAYISEKKDMLQVVAIEPRFHGVRIALARISKPETQ